ncbi:TetR/AcrR family transcriptional regulator [Butyrivibrio sp. INlla21]|uniref:TetR/AcrR family transcriptional regulator n=1 Tax=Butyrivibrio sp. INlla21 TaxID=1520811 RepID=UPI0008EE70A7|nr:TetR/AcrR family transcriptional regulator [Butyrivibrio sp. INlla21]MBR4670782.1 TetR/AcrR family transcriptional regulator [Butyrivibrio sp.]SFU92080.1 transcriptional regulator, TetR family [Butyrivibrio sp. INlla21]
MGEKSTIKKKYILGKAREVFAEKGFKNVTMKDIVDACDISRGGLYLYFSGTDELFLAVLADDIAEDDEEAVTAALSGNASAGDMLALFLKEQKKEILRKKNNLIVATYEYFSVNKVSAKDNPLKKQFDTAVKIVEKLIENGVESGEFYCENPLGCARNLMYVVEGLKITSKTVGINEEAIDKELMYVLEGLVPDELNNNSN